MGKFFRRVSVFLALAGLLTVSAQNVSHATAPEHTGSYRLCYFLTNNFRLIVLFSALLFPVFLALCLHKTDWLEKSKTNSGYVIRLLIISAAVLAGVLLALALLFRIYRFGLPVSSIPRLYGLLNEFTLFLISLILSSGSIALLWKKNKGGLIAIASAFSIILTFFIIDFIWSWTFRLLATLPIVRPALSLLIFVGPALSLIITLSSLILSKTRNVGGSTGYNYFFLMLSLLLNLYRYSGILYLYRYIILVIPSLAVLFFLWKTIDWRDRILRYMFLILFLLLSGFLFLRNPRIYLIVSCLMLMSCPFVFLWKRNRGDRSHVLFKHGAYLSAMLLTSACLIIFLSFLLGAEGCSARNRDFSPKGHMIYVELALLTGGFLFTFLCFKLLWSSTSSGKLKLRDWQVNAAVTAILLLNIAYPLLARW